MMHLQRSLSAGLGNAVNYRRSAAFVWNTAAAVLLLALSLPMAAQQTLYASGYNPASQLLTIDLTSQAVNVIGPMGFPQSPALTFCPSETAYANTNWSSATLAQIATVDLSTG